MSKVTLTPLGTLRTESALTDLNAHLAAIQEEFDNTLSRDGTAPNFMGSNLDMNSNRIINLPDPINEHEPAKYGQISGLLDAIDQIDEINQAVIDAEAAAAAAEAALASIVAGHTHTSSQITDFAEAVYDTTALMLVAGTSITLTPNDGNNTIIIDAAAGDPGDNTIYVEEEGVEVLAAAGTLNFVGSLSTVTNAGSGQVDITFAVPADHISNTMLRNSSALSVIGRAVNSVGDPADIAAGSDGQVLRRSGTDLAFGTVATAGLADDSVTNAKSADMAAWTIKGRNNAASGDPQDIALASLTAEAAPAAGDFLLGFLDTGALVKIDVDDLPGSGGSVSNLTIGTNKITMGIDAGVALPDTDDGRKTIVIGKEALEIATVSNNNIAIGFQSMGQATPGEINLGIGPGTLYNLDADGDPDTKGTRNIGIGGLAGHFITTGSSNVLVGRNAGHSITTGDDHVALGYRALTGGYNPTGLSGEIISIDAVTASGQVGIGYEAGRYSTGQQNVFVGRSSGQNLKLGERNVGIGGFALGAIDEDSTNTAPTGFTISTVNLGGTYTWSGGTTITIDIVGSDVTTGKRVQLEYGLVSSGTNLNGIRNDYRTSVTRVNANQFTVSTTEADHSVTGTSAGAVTLVYKETGTAKSLSEYNTAIGHGAGNFPLRAQRCVFIGAEAGQSAHITADTDVDNILVIANDSSKMPLISGSFLAAGGIGINCRPSDIISNLDVFERVSGTTPGVHLLKITSTEFQIRTSHDFLFNTRSRIASGSDGDLALYNNAKSGFSMLQFGGTGAGFPGLKRNTTKLQVKLANDSAFADIDAAVVNAGRGLALPAGGDLECAYRFTSAATSPGIYCGSGAPTISAPKGSLYLRSDGSADGTTTSNRIYVASSNAGAWKAIMSIA